MLFLRPLAALLLAVLLNAQSPAGRGDIVGTVSDPTGALVPRAILTATSSDNAIRETTVSDAAGAFAFRNLPPSIYTLEVESPGFVRLRRETPLASGAVAQSVLRLEIGQIKETLRITTKGTPKARAASPQLAGAPARIRIGGMVQPAKLLTQVRPEYPADLRDQGIEGTVLLHAIISKTGEPTSIGVQNAAIPQPFADAALVAVRQWRYSPVLLNGEPVEAVTTIALEFRLQP